MLFQIPQQDWNSGQFLKNPASKTFPYDQNNIIFAVIETFSVFSASSEVNIGK